MKTYAMNWVSDIKRLLSFIVGPLNPGLPTSFKMYVRLRKCTIEWYVKVHILYFVFLKIKISYKGMQYLFCCVAYDTSCYFTAFKRSSIIPELLIIDWYYTQILGLAHIFYSFFLLFLLFLSFYWLFCFSFFSFFIFFPLFFYFEAIKYWSGPFGLIIFALMTWFHINKDNSKWKRKEVRVCVC